MVDYFPARNTFKSIVYEYDESLGTISSLKQRVFFVWSCFAYIHISIVDHALKYACVESYSHGLRKEPENPVMWNTVSNFSQTLPIRI